MLDAEQIIEQLEAEGFRAAFLPIGAMEQVRAHYHTLTQRAPETGLAKGAAERFFSNQPPKLDFEPKSILVIALPPGQAGKLRLLRRGKRFEIPVLPFYAQGQKPAEHLKEVLTAAAEGYQLGHTTGISQKLLAALGGLGQYGRNNICFVGDWGTWCELDTHYTDIPFEGPVRESLRMASCDTCDLCRKACPTGAIGDTQVIDANRCLAMRNENRGHMPRWVPKDAHHTLIGCALCQACCPQNPVLNYGSHVLELDKAETRELLSRGKRISKGLARKLEAFGIDWDVQVIKRNARLCVKVM
ncbi:MAG: hypothetical protein FWC27_14285 [Firmicutes bacterium]|nr:hypothetical protein [Bacillota bacterium]